MNKIEFLNIKYSPKTIDECLISNNNKKIINNFIKNKSIINTIFYGDIGVGKSSVINIIINTLTDYNIKHLSLITITDSTFNDLEKLYMYNKRINKKTLLVINDFHLLKPIIQNNFYVLIQHHKDIIIFIETNKLLDINKNIQNICNILMFNVINKNTYSQYINDICTKEKLIISDDVINQLYISSNGDIRNTLIQLTALSKCNNNITIELYESMFSIPSSISINKLIDAILEVDLDKVLIYCDELIQNRFTCEEILLKMFDTIFYDNIDESDKHLLLEQIGKQLYDVNKNNNKDLKQYIKEIIDLF